MEKLTGMCEVLTYSGGGDVPKLITMPVADLAVKTLYFCNQLTKLALYNYNVTLARLPLCLLASH